MGYKPRETKKRKKERAAGAGKRERHTERERERERKTADKNVPLFERIWLSLMKKHIDYT